jgi:hypothetical protein
MSASFSFACDFGRQNPVTNLTQANFGRIISSGDRRILQFALKYVF